MDFFSIFVGTDTEIIGEENDGENCQGSAGNESTINSTTRVSTKKGGENRAKRSARGYKPGQLDR
jgi:hypothetical protein